MSKRSYQDLEDSAPVDPIFGQHKLFQVPEIPEGRLRELVGNVDRVSSVEEYLNMVRYELETTPIGIPVDAIDDEAEVRVDKVDDITEITVDHFTDGFVKWRDDIVIEYDKLRTKYASINQSVVFQYPDSILDWKLLVVNNSPQVPILNKLQLSQKFKLISLYQRWSSKQINDNFIKWIFVMLVLIPDVVSYTELSILRSFAKKLIKLVPIVEDESTKVCYLWCLIIVIERYHQRDLITGLLQLSDIVR